MLQDVKKEEIEAMVKKIIQEHASKKEIALEQDTTLEALGVDSLSAVEMAFALEERLEISIPYSANQPITGDFDFTTVGGVVEAITALSSAQAAEADLRHARKST